LAYHWGQVGDAQKEIQYCGIAAVQAVRSNALGEATDYLKRIVRLLASLPQSRENHLLELTTQLQLGGLLTAVRGFAAHDVGAAFNRARELTQVLGDDVELIPAKWGIWSFYTVRAELAKACSIASEIQATGRSAKDTDIVRLGDYLEAAAVFWTGSVTGLRGRMEALLQTLSRDNQLSRQLELVVDIEVNALSYLAWLLFLRGEADAAARTSRRAIEVARNRERIDHRAFSVGFAAWHWRYRRDFQTSKELAVELIDIGNEFGFPYWLGAGKILLGSAMAAEGSDDGLAELEGGLEIWESTGSRLFRPSFLMAKADALLSLGRSSEADDVLRLALGDVESSNERINEAELVRLRAVIQLQQGDTEAGKVQLTRAIEISQRQGAKAFEVRASSDLAQVLAAEGGTDQAALLLSAALDGLGSCNTWPEYTSARSLRESLLRSS
jgi:tetratricopeptide (TPR) repeat protein